MYFQIVSLFYYFAMVGSSPAKTHLLVTRVGPCYDPQKTIINVTEFSVNTQTYDSKLSGVIDISEVISNGWKMKVTMQKCMDIRNIDSCDFYKSFFVVQNGCAADDDERMFYATLFNDARPKIHCPIRAGRYELRNYSFNSDDNYVTALESKISTSVFGYTFRLDGFAVDSRKIFCLEAYLQLLNRRGHNWQNNADNLATSSSPRHGQEEVAKANTE